MLDRQKLRDHHFEVTYVLGRFLNDHLISVYKAFDGDLTSAIVLGTIGQYNYRRFFTELERDPGHPSTFHARVARGEHLEHVRPCNALSISDSTGIPRETVRRKIRALVQKGWVRQAGRDKLVITDLPAKHFAEFNLDTLEWFHAASRDVERLVERRGRGK